jgi:hypothetical protein
MLAQCMRSLRIACLKPVSKWPFFVMNVHVTPPLMDFCSTLRQCCQSNVSVKMYISKLYYKFMANKPKYYNVYIFVLKSALYKDETTATVKN